MHNLAGVPTPITDAMIRVELAKAGIPAVHVSKSTHGEVPCTVIGILRDLRSGQDIVFERLFCYWAVRLRIAVPLDQAKALNDKWGKVVRINGGPGIEGEIWQFCEEGVYYYHVDTQEGLNALVGAIRGAFMLQAQAAVTEDNEWIARNFDRVHLGSFSHLAAPRNSTDIMLLEIAALRKMASCQRADESQERCLRAALKMADASTEKRFRKEAKSIRVELCTFFRNTARSNRALIGFSNNRDNDDLYASRLEEAQTKRLKLLNCLGRRKEARAVILDLVQIRPEILKLLEAMKEKTLADLKMAADNNNVCRLEWLRSVVTFIYFQLAALCSRMGRRQESDCYQRQACASLDLVVEPYVKDICI